MCASKIQPMSQFKPDRGQRIYLAIMAVAGWVALVGQLWLMMDGRVIPFNEVMIRYLGYFTILTNILAAICATVLALAPGSRWGDFFGKVSVQTAIVVYIVVVGCTYNLVLRQIWDPQGFQRVVDEWLHVGMPVMFFLFWLLWTPKSALQWGDIPGWLVYPALYAAFILVRGAYTGYYPYPFMDAGKLGYDRVLLNSGVLVIFFLVLSLMSVGAAKLTLRAKRR